MSTSSWLQLGALVAVLLITTRVLGAYVAAVFGGGKAPGDRVFAPVERVIYRICGVDPTREQTWPVYAFALLAFSLVSVLGLYAAAAHSGSAAARPDGRLGSASRPRVQHCGLLRHQHELAELRRRADDEPSHPDGRPHGAELRLRRRRSRRRGGADPGLRAPPLGDDRQLLGRPHARHDPRAAAACDRDRDRAREPGGRAEPPRLHPRDDRAGRRPVDPGRPDREPGGDQGARRERRRPVQRQLRPPVRELERLHEPVRDPRPADDPVRAHLYLRAPRQGPAPGLGAVRGHVRDLDRGGRLRHALRGRRQSEAAGDRRRRRQHGGQGDPLRDGDVRPLRRLDDGNLDGRSELRPRQLYAARRRGPARAHDARRGQPRRHRSRSLRDPGLRAALGLHRRA